MGTVMDHTPGEPALLLERLRTGGHGALAALFGRHRDRLRRMVELRMDPRLQARLDPSDVLQEAYLEVARDLDAYLRDPKRYVRALKRLEELLAAMPGGLEGL